MSLAPPFPLCGDLKWPFATSSDKRVIGGAPGDFRKFSEIFLIECTEAPPMAALLEQIECGNA